MSAFSLPDDPTMDREFRIGDTAICIIDTKTYPCVIRRIGRTGYEVVLTNGVMHFVNVDDIMECTDVSLWHVAESWNDDPSLFVGLFEAVTAEQAIDLAVAESIRVDPQFPREKSELVARLESHHKNEGGVWIPVSCEGR